MKSKTSNQIKVLSKFLCGLNIACGSAFLGFKAYEAVKAFSKNNVNEGIFDISLGVLVFVALLVFGITIYFLLKGFILMIDNSCRVANEAKQEEKYHTELKEAINLLAEKLSYHEVKEEAKEDLSHIKKSAKQEVKVEPQSVKKESKSIVLKAKDTENIKEKLARAKGEVQKTMAVRSQVAANTIATNMLDDISDKNSIIEFETPEVYSQVDAELFKDCVNLEKVEITDNIKLIGAEAFSGCDALETIIIGKGVGVIEKNAFSGCTGLDKVIYKGSKKSWDEIVVQSGNEILKRVDITFEE